MKRFVITEEQLNVFNRLVGLIYQTEIRAHPLSTELNKILKELEDYCKDEENLIHKPAECGGFCDPTLNQEALIDKINSMKLKEGKV